MSDDRESREDQPADPKVSDERPEEVLLILPVRQTVLFPGVVLPIAVGRPRSLKAVQTAISEERGLGIVLQKDPSVEHPGPNDLFAVGTSCEILRYVAAPDGTGSAIVQGRRRFRIEEFVREDEVLEARVRWFDDDTSDELADDIKARHLVMQEKAGEIVSLMPHPPEGMAQMLGAVDSPAQLADLLANLLDITPEEKQALLETADLQQRIDAVIEKLDDYRRVLTLSREIRDKAKGEMSRAEREYRLRKELEVIQKELGERGGAEVDELRERIEDAHLPKEALEEATRELDRLGRIPESSPENSVIRDYLEWMIELPWSRFAEESLDIARARKILDEDHYGLEKVKKRILEFLAVKKLAPEGKGPILCLVGPPGVGKTSIGKSVARALNRPFVRLSLGGVHDESEIRGHRRTYIGAMPGNIIRSLRKAAVANPVFMLDEMDKLGTSFRGDPAAALLEVLDPEQNREFRDHYLGVPFDLSRVLFIGTANVLDQIPGPLRDRLEIIEIPGYTHEEKLEIAKRYLLPKALASTGLDRDRCRVTDAALNELIRGYTREAGCRRLEREIHALARSVATRIAEGETASVTIDADDVVRILGPRRYESEVALRTSVTGVATGLAWTPVGGEILFVEATRIPGKGGFVLTGQLGDVMKESARTALSLVKLEAHERGIDLAFFDEGEIHVHVPAGAVPKDGPSAGVAIYTALLSLLLDRKVRHDVAMTGEISLRGLVLPVGGIKEKVLAARAAGLRRVLLPKRNEKDLVDLPESARRDMEFAFLDHVRQLPGLALEGELEGAAQA